MRIAPIVFLLLVLCELVFVQGALDSTIGSAVDNASAHVDKVREVVEEERWNYIGESLKSILLNNTYIAPIDGAFHSSNLAFVILLGRDYSFSLELFLSFMLWLFTLLILHRALDAWFQDSSLRVALAVSATIILAQAQIFNFFATLAYRVILYKSSPIWSFLSSIIIIVAIVFYFYLGRIFSRKLLAARRLNRMRSTEKKVNDQDKLLKEVEKGLKN